MSPSPLTAPAAGSNAGRGFRYQDLVGALFAVRMHLGERGFDAITPEGSDDYEIRGASGLVLVDTKSNRPDARQRSQSTDIRSLETLWARPTKADENVAEYWLVTERTRNDATVGKLSVETLYDDKPPVNASRSFLLVVPDPLLAAIELLVEQRGLTPLAAELVILAFAKEIGDLASANGALQLGQRKAFTTTDTERVASRVLNAVDVDRLDALTRSGFVRPVDFVTPLDDAGFYLGVDVQPGHFAAGLALDRPERAEQVAEALQRTGTAVVSGPSGAGKSSLMWNAVIARRASRRWFRVNTSVPFDADALTAFFEAFATTEIGFVIDDVGRGGLDAWKALRPRTETHGRAVMIGSIRSEDAALLEMRHKIAEVDVVADEHLARALWERLRERGQSKWPGWREPWDKARGLLLEYGHILTVGERLEAVILDQVRRRLNEKRDHELAILSASSIAAAHGGVVSIATLRAYLKLDAAGMTRALERLVEEHLVRVDTSGAALTGLHALRAAAISSALITIGYSTPLDQACGAIAVSEAASLEPVVSGLIASGVISAVAAAEAVAARGTGQTLSELATAVRGLRAGSLSLVVRDWLVSVERAGIPRKLATGAAFVGVMKPEDLPDIGHMRELAKLGNNLHTSASAERIPLALVASLISAIRRDAEHARTSDLVDALSALARTSLSAEQQDELARVRIPLTAIPMPDVVRILDAAESIAPAIALAWASKDTNANLLRRLSDETPFALPLTAEETDEGLIVRGDIYEAALTEGENPNERLVAYVEAIMRVEQRAIKAHVRLVDMTGTKSLHLDAEKRMPRGNAPPKALAGSNRTIIDAAAREVGKESWSHYLTRGEELLQRGVPALRRLLDGVMVGRVNEQALNELNDVVKACDDLIAPLDPPESVGAQSQSGRHVTPLQDLIFNSNSELVSRVLKLPDSAGVLAAHTADLVKRAEAAKAEPWSLVGDGPPRRLYELQKILGDIEIIALEAAASGADPRQRWSKTNRKPKDAFALVAQGSRNALLKRIEARRSAIAAFVTAELPDAVVLAPKLSEGIIWQAGFVGTVPIGSFEDLKQWITRAREIGERLRTLMKDNEDLVLIPMINGHAAVDYSYRLSRGKPESIIAQILVAAGQTHLLGAPDQSAIDRINAPVLRHPPELGKFFLAVRDFIGMSQLQFGTPNRPVAEQQRLVQALATIAQYGPRLMDLFNGLNHPAVDAMREFLRVILSEQTEGQTLGATFSLEGIQDLLAELTWKRSLLT